MIVDGKKLAGMVNDATRTLVEKFPRPPVLEIVIVGNDPVIESFVRIKKRAGESLGVLVRELRFPETVSGEELISAIRESAKDPESSGIIVQLPLPKHVETQAVLNAVPMEKDVDVLSADAMAAFARGELPIIPPVAGAIKTILESHNIPVSGKEALVLGHGRLVGVPAAVLLRRMGAHVTVADKPLADMAEHARESALIVCGTGNPGLLQKHMLTKGVAVIDAGTSEQGGKIVGDASPECAEVAGIFTPVPGGVGPISVAMIFKNLCILASFQSEK